MHSHSSAQPSLVHSADIRRLRSCQPHLSCWSCCLLLLVSLLCVDPSRCLFIRPRQQHNVWYNGLFISGIAVDEASGDVFFSDAAGNRVVHQARNGSVLHVYDDSGFFSPMQLAYHAGKLYVADSSNNRVAVIDVKQRTVSFSSTPPSLSSVSGLAYNSGTGSVVAVDGSSLQSMVWSPVRDEWSHRIDIWPTIPQDSWLAYLSSVAVQPLLSDAGPVWLTDALGRSVYETYGDQAHLGFVAPNLGQLAVQYFATANASQLLYTLLQPEVDGPMQIVLTDSGGTIINTWISPGRGGAAVPFFGWAMHVDSNGSMYVSDHGVDAVSSPYGRVVQLAANGSEAGSWSMSDGVAYALSAVWYEGEREQGGDSEQGAESGQGGESDSCGAYWVADSERGVGRLAGNGSVLLPFVDAPIDPADRLTARFTGMAQDGPLAAHSNHSSFVLLDTASAATTKLWRFVPAEHSFHLLNTTAARLGAGIVGLAVEQRQHWIFVSDTRTRSVIRLDWAGELDAAWDTSGLGVVEPGALCWDARGNQTSLYVVDGAHDHGVRGVVMLLDYGQPSSILHVFKGFDDPPMFQPRAVTLDPANQQLYVADSAGVVHQFDLTTTYPTEPAFVHVTVPTAANIASITVNVDGDVFMVDSYSRRIVVLEWNATSWYLGNGSAPPGVLVSSSATPAPFHPSLSSSSWSSSSTASSALTAQSLWSVTAVLGVAVVGVVAVAVGATCFCTRWKRWQGWRGRMKNETNEGLWSAGENEEGVTEVDEEEQEEAEYVYVVDNDEENDKEGEEEADTEEDKKEAHDAAMRPAVVDDEQGAAARRYGYYVARYEVVAVVREIEQLNDDGRQQWVHRTAFQQPSHSLGTPPPSLRISPATAAGTSATSVSTDSAHSSASHASTSSTSAGDSSPATVTSASSTTPASVSTSSSVLALASPRRHIAELRSVWHTLPTVIDSVTDLTILGEGSSGVVYRGVYRGQACVVKLPKSAALTGAAWREWQWHLSLPPHRHLVHFLGALPMSSTSYLVTAYVQQGSLHSLLCSSHAARSTQYSRPYAVMRCMRDMVCVLCHMHSAGVVHRDVSCRNILVDSDGCMVLADLGLAIQLARRDGARGGEVAVDSLQTAVPVRWTSPEALQSSAYSSASDVWSLGVAVWEMTAGGALPYGDTQHSSTAACIRPIVAGQLALHIDERWGRGGGGGGGSRGGGGGGGKGDGGSGGDSVSGDGSAGTHTTASTQHTLSRAEQQLADRVRRLTHAALQYDVQQRPDSHTMQQAVESEWNEWQAEWASEADELHAEWAAYHAEVQRRLGAPRQHSDIAAS